MESYSLLLEKEYFKFSCAHFLIFPDGSKERLHGHNYQLRCEISGAIGDRGLLIDFIQVKPVIRELCDYLDEHLILPGEHPELKIEASVDGHTAFQYRDCKYMVPTEELIILPVNNSSAENFAHWMAHQLRERLVERFGRIHVKTLRIAISETSGQSGVYTLSDDA